MGEKGEAWLAFFWQAKYSAFRVLNHVERFVELAF